MTKKEYEMELRKLIDELYKIKHTYDGLYKDYDVGVKHGLDLAIDEVVKKM